PHSILRSVLRPPPISPLFPYTTLFRSVCSVLADPRALLALHQHLYGAVGQAQELQDGAERADLEDVVRRRLVGLRLLLRREEDRSEEHTSELQSPYDLVCRLLLEKKKQ